MSYVAPARKLESFHCPYCGVYARQNRYSIAYKSFAGDNAYRSDDWLATSICQHCEEATLWLGDKMLHPNRGSAPLPNTDMPKDVLEDYEEAAVIAGASPKAAAALMRLAIQKLCVHLGGNGHNINDDVRDLVKKGLPAQVQQALDVVRVVGNNAVHPGQIDLDNTDIVSHMFGLINIIVETMISTPQRIATLYGNLPQGAREAIAKRDGSPPHAATS